MDSSDGGWTAESETKVDGSCRPHQEPDYETTPQEGEDKGLLSISRTQKQSKAYMSATQSAWIATAYMSHTNNTPIHSQRHKDLNTTPTHDLRLGQNPEWSRASQNTVASGTLCSSTANQVDPKLYIPRTVENIITPIKISELFPHLRECGMEKCIHICEQYRDAAYNGGCDHLGGFDPELYEREHSSQGRKVTDDQQDTPAIERRQDQGP